MKFENSGFESIKIDLNRLNEIMSKHRMVLAGQWDYERVTYDHKFQVKEGTYYLRIPGYSVEGDVGSRKALIQLMAPLLGKHYYPHGVEYGDDEYFPEHLVKQCQKMLENIKKDLELYSE
ncbi:YugN family protein [Siminovitchia sp. 179-K 8D1 HS]|uniref:YugN family protein n=1 Tax=Siminovitchia sp. 179-K 8D1 HS TaxID=3142385 RepID=UPI00399F95BC